MDLRKKDRPKISLEAIKKKIETTDRQKWIVLLLLGVLLLVIAMPVRAPEEESAEDAREEEEETEERAERSYEVKLEERLKAMIEGIDGVGRAEVMITLEDGGETVVVCDVEDTDSTQTVERTDGGTESRRENSRSESVVLADDMPYDVKQIEPKVRGVCVVAQGAGSDAVKLEIYHMIQALFNVDAHKIAIVEMGS